MSQPDPKLGRLTEADGRPTLQTRVAAAIVEAAARTLALQGDQASMRDVAQAAGVARATVYRYFPTRQALLDELLAVAGREAGVRLSAARIDHIGVYEGVSRAVRALIEVGDLFVVVARQRIRPDTAHFEKTFVAPLQRLLERGQSSGEIRGDIPSAWLARSLVGLVASVLATNPSLGREDIIVAVTGLFLYGARAPVHGVTVLDS